MRIAPTSFALACAVALALRAGATRDVDPHEDAAAAYRIETSTAPVKVKKGEKALAKLAVVPRSDAHVHPDAPISVALSAGPLLELPKAKLGRADARETKEKGVEFQVPFAGKSSGKDELKASVSFFICTEKVCERQKREVALAVQVE